MSLKARAAGMRDWQGRTCASRERDLGKASGRFTLLSHQSILAQHPQRAPIPSHSFFFPSFTVPYQTDIINQRVFNSIIKRREQQRTHRSWQRRFYVSTFYLVVFSTISGGWNTVAHPPRSDSARHFLSQHHNSKDGAVCLCAVLQANSIPTIQDSHHQAIRNAC